MYIIYFRQTAHYIIHTAIFSYTGISVVFMKYNYFIFLKKKTLFDWAKKIG